MCDIIVFMIIKILKGLVACVILMMIGMMMWIIVTDWLLPVVAVNSFEKENLVPTFTELETGYEHVYSDIDKTFPMVDVISLDTNNDGTNELLVTGAAGQNNVVLSYNEGRLTPVDDTGLTDTIEATYGLEVTDIDNDGDDDVISAQQNGVFMYTNDNGNFTPVQLPLEMEPNTIAFEITAGDVDKDGYPDLYISTFMDKTVMKQMVFNDKSNQAENIFLRNNGDSTFTDATVESGLQFRQNTFLARFADINGNSYPDLLVSPNTDQARIYENNTDGTFTEHVLTDFGYWMGIATGDIDNDGDLDVFFSNVGNTVPGFMVGGDALESQPIDTSWRLFQNDGNFSFTDVTVEKGVDSNIFAWGSEFADFNNDERLDLVVTENFLGLPMMMHKFYRNPGKLFIQAQDGTFTHTERESRVSNRLFGYVPLPTDIDNDGNIDLVIVNQNGPLRVFMNDGAN